MEELVQQLAQVLLCSGKEKLLTIILKKENKATHQNKTS
jgi:hypothetical protein